MKRLSTKEKERILNLSKKGLSLSNIAQLLNLSKSTTYYWFLKFVGRTYSSVKFNKLYGEELGEILGIFASDGCFYRQKNGSYRMMVYLSLKQYAYAQKIRRLLYLVFRKRSSIYKDQTNNMYIINVYGEEILKIIKSYLYWDPHDKKTYSVRLKYPILKYDQSLLRGFVSGLFFGDGWSTAANTGFGSVSLVLLLNFVDILRHHNILPSLYCFKKER